VRQGATTIWERWDGWTEERGFQDPGMNSLCHYAFGSIGEWLFRHVGGIGSGGAGFGELLIRPRPLGGLTFARCRYDSVRGPVATEWRVVNGELLLVVEVPANATALVCVPSVEGTEVLEGNAPARLAAGVNEVGREDGCAVFRVGSGKFSFVSLLPA
jgi:alpha-L-rhamnosidase